jgi:hypothetical protein
LQPDLPPEQTAPELIGVGAKSIIDNAQRLGLEWQLRLATVLEGSDPAAISAVYDGDANNPIDMTSMIGTLSQGQRVYVIIVPPAGNFITGSVNGLFYRARKTLTTTASSIVFSEIPANLRSLIVRWTARSSGGTATAETRMQMNGLTTAIYGSEHIQAVGAVLTAGLTALGVSMFVGAHAAASATSGIYGTGEICFADWDIATSRLGSVNWTAGVFAGGGVKQEGTGTINVSVVRTSLTFFPNTGSWASGTDFQLEGVPS